MWTACLTGYWRAAWHRGLDLRRACQVAGSVPSLAGSYFWPRPAKGKYRPLPQVPSLPKPRIGGGLSGWQTILISLSFISLFLIFFLTVISILKEKFTVICYISVNSDFSYWKREKMSLSESLSTWMIIYYKIRHYLWHREEQWHDLIFCQNHVS